MKVDFIVGARPNFMKLAPIIRAIKKKHSKHIDWRIIHTGQHYDKKMSDIFFSQLDIPLPDYNLGVGSGTHASQTGSIMISYEKLLIESPSDYCMVLGDVNSTVSGALVAKKLGMRLGHVEGGLRSGDIEMPEEINRLVTDSISDDFFVTSNYAVSNLIQEGHDNDKIHFVGNTMIDTLIHNINNLKSPFSADHNPNPFILLTIHRPANVDNIERLKEILNSVIDGAKGKTIVFPVHPRTRLALENLEDISSKFLLLEPQPYQEFIYLLKNCEAVVSDSGGISEEATFLSKQCITLRDTTERPETIDSGYNVLVGNDLQKIAYYLDKLKNNEHKEKKIPNMWDGNAGERIAEVLIKISRG